MSYTSYETLNNLGEVSFIAGTEYEFTFHYFTDSSLLNPADLTGFTCVFRMALYGQTTVLTKAVNGVVTLPNIVTVTLATADTEALFGKYLYQPVLQETATSKDYILGQGTIIISPQIASS